MSFELRDHTADVAVSAQGDSLGETFAAVADGMAAAMCAEVPETGDRAEIQVSAEGREALLFDYLDELLYERDVNAVLPVDNRATVREPADDNGPAHPDEPAGTDEPAHTDEPTGTEQEPWHVEASYRGVPLRAIDARDLKAVTYSEMDISPSDDGWTAYVVFDV